MSVQVQHIRFRVRGKTAAEWASSNEVLLERELGLETDTRKFKFGTGVTPWGALEYAGAGAGGSVGMQVAGGFVQWRGSDADPWEDLIAVSDLIGPSGDDGAAAEFRYSGGYLQWRLVGAPDWVNLAPSEDLRGPPGSGSYGTMGACFFISDAQLPSIAVRANCAGVITSATLLGGVGQTGAAVVDVRKVSFAGYSDGAVSICGGNKPSVSGSKSEDLLLDGWAVDFAAGDVFIFAVESIAGFSDLSLTLGVTKI